jgi:hypothetical protein
MTVLQSPWRLPPGANPVAASNLLMLIAAWILLVLVHGMPAAVLAQTGLITPLYGVEAAGDLGVLLIHRGGRFLAIFVVCLYAAWEPGVRRAASRVVVISVVSSLTIYVLAGAPAGSLRLIALADLIVRAPWNLRRFWAAPKAQVMITGEEGHKEMCPMSASGHAPDPRSGGDAMR